MEKQPWQDAQIRQFHKAMANSFNSSIVSWIVRDRVTIVSWIVTDRVVIVSWLVTDRVVNVSWLVLDHVIIDHPTSL